MRKCGRGENGLQGLTYTTNLSIDTAALTSILFACLQGRRWVDPWDLSRSLKFSIKNQPPFLCGLMPLVDMGIVANKSIDFIGFKYAVVTSLV